MRYMIQVIVAGEWVDTIDSASYIGAWDTERAYIRNGYITRIVTR